MYSTSEPLRVTGEVVSPPARPARVRARRRWLARALDREAAAWLLTAVFVAWAAALIDTLAYNFDEGVYIQQALLILDGQLPYRDFFYHQTPLYPFTLAIAAAVSPESLFAYRFVSLLATAAAGLVFHRIAVRFLGRRTAMLALLLFYGAPLQFYGLVALPQALMQLCFLAGLLLVLRREPLAVAGGGALFALSLLYKPLSLPACMAVGVALLVSPRERWKLGWILPAGAAAGLLAWGVCHVMSDGLFTELLLVQMSRFAGKSGFEKMWQYEIFRGIAFIGEVTTAISWNVNEHRRAFLQHPANGNVWLLFLATWGIVLLWAPRGGRWAGWRLLVTLWWVIPFVFSLFIWEPVWDHYCIVYLPPMSILAALAARSLWEARRWRRLARTVAVLTVIGVVLLGAGHLITRRYPDLDALAHGPSVGERWLTFDPFINFVTRTEPACGIIDPFNVYGEWSLARDSPLWQRYVRGTDDVIRCLENDPEAMVAFGFWAAWFPDPDLQRYVDALPPERKRQPPAAAWPLGWRTPGKGVGPALGRSGLAPPARGP